MRVCFLLDLGDGKVGEHVIVSEVGGAGIPMLIRRPLVFGHVRVARTHVLVLASK